MHNLLNLKSSRSLIRYALLSVLAGFCIVLAAGALHAPVSAQTTINRGTIAEILDGNQVYIQNNQARVNDTANRGQQVRTGSARAQVTFNTGAVARLASNSVLTIGQCAQLQRGILLVNGAVNGCTASVTAGVRGTTYILQVDEDGGEQVKVLEGEVVVTRQGAQAAGDRNMWLSSGLSSKQFRPRLPRVGGSSANDQPSDSPTDQSTDQSTDQPADQPTDQPTEDSGDTIVLTTGQKLATRPGERLGRPGRISAEEIAALLAGELFDGFLQELPGIAELQNALQQLYPNVPLPFGAPSNIIPRPRLPF